MDRKEIQEQRMKGYFIDSAVSIIRGEGLRSISVRNIAERAGYTYATLYNYFKNLPDLLYHCMGSFSDECADFVNSSVKSDLKGSERILALSKAFSNYFVQYPAIFELFYTERLLASIPFDKLNEVTQNLYFRIFNEAWNELGEKKKDLPEKHNFLLLGELMQYLLRRNPADYGQFTKELDKNLKGILQ